MKINTEVEDDSERSSLLEGEVRVRFSDTEILLNSSSSSQCKAGICCKMILAIFSLGRKIFMVGVKKSREVIRRC